MSGNIDAKKHAYGLAVISTAFETAKTYGVSFVVFCGGYASNVFIDDGAARDKARQYAEKYGRENVRIRPVRVPHVKV
jgi:hypothetical protein